MNEERCPRCGADRPPLAFNPEPTWEDVARIAVAFGVEDVRFVAEAIRAKRGGVDPEMLFETYARVAHEHANGAPDTADNGQQCLLPARSCI